MMFSPDPSPSAARAQTIALLTPLFRDGVALYLAAWQANLNVTGPSAGPLHDLFGEVYVALFGLADHLAESIRALGGTVDVLGSVTPRSGVGAPAGAPSRPAAMTARAARAAASPRCATMKFESETRSRGSKSPRRMRSRTRSTQRPVARAIVKESKVYLVGGRPPVHCPGIVGFIVFDNW
jgi:hypothetical protein